MSSKRITNRKAKVKTKQASRATSSILGSGPLEADKAHNQSLPCCLLLRDVIRDIFGTDGDDSSSSETRPTSLLGHMLCKKLLEDRQERLTSKSAETPEPSNSKKKKKKKKKKTSKEAGAASAGDTAFETATAADLDANTAAQDSQSQEPSPPSPIETPASSEPMSATNTTGTEALSSVTGPVDSYLDRVLQRQQQQSEEKPPIQRDIHSFVDYLNQKLQRGICVPHSQLKTASQSIACPACRDAVNNLLQQDAPQPILLNPILFTGFPSTSNSTPQNKYMNSNNINKDNGNKKHNGLEVPILNQKPAQAEAQAQVQDFDYVALEEGTNPMATMMEVQANRSGVPYFHPITPPGQPETTTGSTASASASASNGNSSGKKQNKASSSEPTVARQEMEWLFVTASAANKEEEEGVRWSKNAVNPISVQDLEYVVKEVMVPMALSPDELMGAYTDLGYPELQKVFQRAQELEHAFSKELDRCQSEAEHYGATCNELWKQDNEHNVDFKTVPSYHDLDYAVHSMLEGFVLDTIWDRLLWLCGSGNTVVVRPTPMWENVVAELSNMCIKTILGVMQAVETYENQLEDIANSQGAIPHLFVNKSHRECYRAMIETKQQLVMNLIEQVRQKSLTLEPAMFGGEGGAPPQAGTNALVVTFRRKWFTQQEFFRQVEIKQKHDGLTASDGKKGGAQDSVTSGGSSSDTNGQGSEVPVSDRWIQTLDILGVDLIRGLLDFAKTELKGRIWEIKEEHMVRCQKLVGLLARVGYDIFRPLVETDKNDGKSTLRFHLLGFSLRKQCETVWSQIQQQKVYLQAVVLQEVECPHVDEQKQIVAKMAVDAIHLLRHLRKCVTVNYGPNAPPPSMPLKLVAWMSPATPTAGFAHMDSNFYDNLVSAATLAEVPQHQRCLGAGGQSRTKSLLLALVYQKLADQCSEWHAELAEQELLTSMNTDVNALNDANANIAKKEVDTSRAKAAKKMKKKKDKKAASPIEAQPEILKGNTHRLKGPAASPTFAPAALKQNNDTADTVDVGGVTTQFAGDDEPSEAFEKNLNEHAKPTNGTANKGHKKGKEVIDRGLGEGTNAAKRTEEIKDSCEYNGHGKIHLETSTTNANNKSGKGKNSKEAGKAFDLDTTAIDKCLGVSDGAGVFHSAESYLVGRLTNILNQANSDSSRQGNDALRGNRAVVII